jgi:pimeloyl-ACP methyl ester carboxylesterase
MQICNATTSAQFFHLLRRQALDPAARPLVVMTPKGLLRLREALATLDQLAEGTFRPVIPDPTADPDAVRRLVLVDAVGPTGWWLPRLVPDAVARLEARGDERAAEELRPFLSEDLGRPDPALHARYARALYPAWFADPELARLLSPPHAESATGAAVVARLRTEGYDWREAVRALRVPTLVIHGDEDLLPVDVAREIGAEAPQAQVALVPGAGHMPFWESPAHFFELVEHFLAR